jgi:PqqD family protein of HPr-rel-A system
MPIPSRFVVKEVESDLILYDTDSDEVHILNPTAGAIYRLLLEGKREDEIVKALRTTYRAEEGNDLERDVRECVEDLLKKGLTA